MKTPKEIAKFICTLHKSDFDNLDYFDKLEALRHAQATVMACKELIKIYTDAKVNGNNFLFNIERTIMNMKAEQMNFEQFLEMREDQPAREQPVYTEGQKLEMLYQQEQQEKYYFEQ
jgi:hypothetical protein